MKRASIVLSALALVAGTTSATVVKADGSGQLQPGHWQLASSGTVVAPNSPQYQAVIRDCRSILVTTGENICDGEAQSAKQQLTVEALVLVGNQQGKARESASAYSF